MKRFFRDALNAALQTNCSLQTAVAEKFASF